MAVMIYLAEFIKKSPNITGISVCEKDHKIVSGILLFITNPKARIPAVLDVIHRFSKFSAFKVKFSKYEFSHDIRQSISPHPFKWSPKGFTDLGISSAPSLEAVGRIAFIKMSILQRLLY